MRPGFTMFSGVPYIRYQGFRGGKPLLDFTDADRQMRVVKDMGFLAVSSYGAGVVGLEAYHEDTGGSSTLSPSPGSTSLKADPERPTKYAAGRRRGQNQSLL